MPRQAKTRTYGTRRARPASTAEQLFVQVKQSSSMRTRTAAAVDTVATVDLTDCEEAGRKGTTGASGRVRTDQDQDNDELGFDYEAEDTNQAHGNGGNNCWTPTPADVDELAEQVSAVKITEPRRRRPPRKSRHARLSPAERRPGLLPSPASTPSPTAARTTLSPEQAPGPEPSSSVAKKLFMTPLFRPSLGPPSAKATPIPLRPRPSINPARGSNSTPRTAAPPSPPSPPSPPTSSLSPHAHAHANANANGPRELRTLSWADVCPPGDTITKIAEASFAEVYRVTNALGTSIIKTIRLPSPIKPQTAAQVRAELVDEEPHSEADVAAELQISEWLAAVPGFVVYKERYVVSGRATAELLDTHRKFHNKTKRKDPDRLQFYPSPARYLDETRFLVVELGDAGTALEDLTIETAEEMWDIFLLVALALARAEEWAAFEHRDLHEGNVCIRRTRPARRREDEDRRGDGPWFGYSGLDITILDYGISRASCPWGTGAEAPVAFDLERDLSLFTSTHAPQCAVYRQMRSHLLRGDRVCLPPEAHDTPYAPTSWSNDDDAHTHHVSYSDSDSDSDSDPDADPLQRKPAGKRRWQREQAPPPISWAVSAPYTNVLWLAYLYRYVAGRGPAGKGAAFKGARPALKEFRRETQELRRYLDPDEGERGGWPSFGSAGEVVRFATEAGWIAEEEVLGGGEGGTLLGVLREDEVSIIRGGEKEADDDDDDDDDAKEGEEAGKEKGEAKQGRGGSRVVVVEVGVDEADKEEGGTKGGRRRRSPRLA